MLTQRKALPSTRPPLPSPRRFSRLSQVRASSDRTRHLSLARLTHPLGWCTEGAKIVEICQKGDKLLDEEIAKVVITGEVVHKNVNPTIVRHDEDDTSRKRAPRKRSA